MDDPEALCDPPPAQLNERSRHGGQQVLVWDLPLRLWHWTFAVCVTFSLYTGLAGDISLMTWHQRSGLTILGLLAFRLCWGVWGGRYARLRHYFTTPSKVLDHFRKPRVGGHGTRGHKSGDPHTAPGIALVALLFLVVAVQATTGLFATDDIFNEGPLNRYVSKGVARDMTWIHHRALWGIIGLITVHLTAHAIYGLWLKDPTPLAMFSGRKFSAVAPTRHFYGRAALTAAAIAAVALALLARG
ncbi:MAG: cytochrome b/b6 domain-containing protein [Gammaproteobacteria bacterium]|nr:cytochrome b/b6 domain-containing protein [Gammaproteobacteria bacterium]